MTVHTIILVQPSPHDVSRTYYDAETIEAAMDKVASLYEQQLQRDNPGLAQIQYRADDLLHFIDSYSEFVALVFEPQQQIYIPKDKEWIKSSIIAHFSKQHQRPPSGQPIAARMGGGSHRPQTGNYYQPPQGGAQRRW